MAEKPLALVAAALIAVVLLAACGGGGDGGGAAESTTHATAEHDETGTTGETTTPAEGGGGQAVTVEVAELGGSGQTGTATLTELAGGTHVVVELRGGRGGVQPADIRKGTCERPASRPEFELQNLSSGHGETHVEVPLQTLLSVDYVLLVQRSTSEANAHVACAYLAAL